MLDACRPLPTHVNILGGFAPEGIDFQRTESFAKWQRLELHLAELRPGHSTREQSRSPQYKKAPTERRSASTCGHIQRRVLVSCKPGEKRYTSESSWKLVKEVLLCENCFIPDEYLDTTARDGFDSACSAGRWREWPSRKCDYRLSRGIRGVSHIRSINYEIE